MFYSTKYMQSNQDELVFSTQASLLVSYNLLNTSAGTRMQYFMYQNCTCGTYMHFTILHRFELTIFHRIYFIQNSNEFIIFNIFICRWEFCSMEFQNEIMFCSFYMQFLMELIQLQLHFGRYFVKCQFTWLRNSMHLSRYALKIISSHSRKLKVCRAKNSFILIFWEFPTKLKVKLYIMKSSALFFLCLNIYILKWEINEFYVFLPVWVWPLFSEFYGWHGLFLCLSKCMSSACNHVLVLVNRTA